MKHDIDFCLFSMILKKLPFIDELKLSLVRWQMLGCPILVELFLVTPRGGTLHQTLRPPSYLTGDSV